MFSPLLPIILIAFLCYSWLVYVLRVVVRFQERGLHVARDIADGNCLLNSIQYTLKGEVGSVTEMRNILVAAFSSDWDQYSHLFPELDDDEREALLDELNTDGEWDSETMDLCVTVLAKYFQCGMILFFLRVPSSFCIS